MRKSRFLLSLGPLAVALGCSDGSPTSPGNAARAATVESIQAPIVRADPRSRNGGVVSARGDQGLPPGTWGSEQASVTIKPGGTNVEIFALALPPSGCFGSYGDIARQIPNGRFSLPGTYTQLTGAYPGKVEYPAQFSGFVEGSRMTITITVPRLTQALGPFVLKSGVTNAWGPCLYP